jgi:hypothetical protein
MCDNNMNDDEEQQRVTELRLFLEELPHVASVEQLTHLLCTRVGLYRDERPLYGEFARFQRDRGLWQDPRQLASFLWVNKNLFRSLGIRSFLEVGTFHGYSFFVILAFLHAHVDERITGLTLDINDFLDPALRPFIGDMCRRGSSRDLVHDSPRFDLVFIDAEHTLEAVTEDYLNVGVSAKACLFHDVNDKHCLGVGEFWRRMVARSRGEPVDYDCTGQQRVCAVVEAFETACGDAVFGLGLATATIHDSFATVVAVEVVVGVARDGGASAVYSSSRPLASSRPRCV